MSVRYYKIEYSGALALVALYDIGRREAHAIITPISSYSPTQDNFASCQIEQINRAAEDIAVKYSLTPVFKRYFLSDVANQSELLPEKERCATSVIQQPPLDGSKAVLFVIFEQDAHYKDAGDGVWISGRDRIWAGDNNNVSPGDSHTMTLEYLESLSSTLSRRGGSLKDNCLRTWFFVRDIDNNYAGMVKARNEVFQLHGLNRTSHFIASTGIEGVSAPPGRIVAFNSCCDLSVKPGQINFLYGKTHLNPTYEYGVAFERGVAVDYGDRRHIYISGTASIDNEGRIVAPGNIIAQTLRMLENIEILLREAGSDKGDICHMIVYLRDMADFKIVKDIFHKNYADIPVAIVMAPVCRPGWLVETECMAIRKLTDSGYEPF